MLLARWELPMGLQYLGLVTTRLAIVALSSMAIVQCAEAADLYCMRTYHSVDKSRLSLLFPSGREPNAQTCRDLLIKGAIENGDSAKFMQILKASHPFLDRVWLWSSGGSVEEAIKVGRLIRNNLIETEAPSDMSEKPAGRGWYFINELVPGCPERNRATPPKGAGCQCASACFLIWAAGVERYGDSLGLHRPTIASTSFASMPPDRASATYRALLADISKFLIEMEIPPRFIEFMIDVSSTDIRWLTRDEAEALEEVPSVHEWIAATCGAMSKEEKDTLIRLEVEADQLKTLSPRNRMLLDQLQKRSSEISLCAAKKVRLARDAIHEPH